jgi:hypothetical protein
LEGPNPKTAWRGKDRKLFGASKIVVVAAGKLHTVAVAKGGVLWVWGCGANGQLGLGKLPTGPIMVYRPVPTRLGAEEVFGSRVRMAACGDFHTLVVTEKGGVWAFGKGTAGQLGLNDQRDKVVPTHVNARRFAGAQVATVAAGCEHSAAVTDGGVLFTWGPDRLLLYSVPTPVSPHLLHGARVGQWHGLAEELALAFAMGTHARLGAGAGGAGGRGRGQGKAPAGGEDDRGCPYLMMSGDLVKRVVEACCAHLHRWGAAGKGQAFGEGVLRLMGARRTRC